MEMAAASLLVVENTTQSGWSSSICQQRLRALDVPTRIPRSHSEDLVMFQDIGRKPGTAQLLASLLHTKLAIQ